MRSLELARAEHAIRTLADNDFQEELMQHLLEKYRDDQRTKGEAAAEDYARRFAHSLVTGDTIEIPLPLVILYLS